MFKRNFNGKASSNERICFIFLNFLRLNPTQQNRSSYSRDEFGGHCESGIAKKVKMSAFVSLSLLYSRLT